MAKRRTPTDCEKNCNKILNALIKLSQNLLNDRQFLQGQTQFFYQFIYQMKMEHKVESLKANLILGLKDREAVVYKHRYENTEDDLADFREWFDYLSEKCLGPTDASNEVRNKGEGSQNKAALQDEVRKLKCELEAYKLEKNSEISALLAEKNFVWNQLKKMESDFTEQLKKKSDEVERANEKIRMLVKRAEELQMSNEKLRADFTKMEAETLQKSQEIFTLSKENDLLKTRSGSGHRSLHACRSEATESSKRDNITVKKEADPSQTTEKATHTRRSAHKSTGGMAPRKQFTSQGSSSSRRKAIDVITFEDDDTRRLFSSSFKVPKLKST